MNSPPNRWFVKFRGHTLGPLQTSQIVSSIQKRELGVTDKIASASNPIWKEIGTEKEFASLFPKVSTDSLPLPTPSILMGKNVNNPKLNSSDSLEISTSLENSAFFSAGAENVSNSPISTSGISVPTGSPSPQKPPFDSSTLEVSNSSVHSISFGALNPAATKEKKSKKKTINVAKTNSKKKFGSPKSKLPKNEALLHLKKKTPPKKESSPEPAPLSKELTKELKKEQTEPQLSSESISSNNSVLEKNTPIQTVVIDSKGIDSTSIHEKTSENLSARALDTESNFASSPLPAKELSQEKIEKEKVPYPSYVQNTNWKSSTDELETKIPMKNLTELFQDLPSNLGSSMAFSEATEKQSHRISIPSESDRSKQKIHEETKWKDSIHLQDSKWKNSERMSAWISESSGNLETDFTKSISKAKSDTKTIQIQLTISKASVTILFLCLLLLGIGVYGLVEYKKMRDLKDSHLPDPSSPTIELSTSDDPIPSLKAPTRPKRE